MKKLCSATLAGVRPATTNPTSSPSTLLSRASHTRPVAVASATATHERVAVAVLGPRSDRGALMGGVVTTIQRLMRLTRVSRTETEGRLTAHERRVVRAIDEAQDVRDAAAQLDAHMAASMADGDVSPAEAWQAYRLAQRVLREARESVVAAQWTDAGERKAAAGLLDTQSVPRIERYEREILQQADELGMVLAGIEPGRMIAFPTVEPQDAA